MAPKKNSISQSIENRMNASNKDSDSGSDHGSSSRRSYIINGGWENNEESYAQYKQRSQYQDSASDVQATESTTIDVAPDVGGKSMDSALWNIGKNTAVCMIGGRLASFLPINSAAASLAKNPYVAKVGDTSKTTASAWVFGEFLSASKSKNDSKPTSNAAYAAFTTAAVEGAGWALKAATGPVGSAVKCLAASTLQELMEKSLDIKQRAKRVKASPEFNQRINNWINTTAKDRVDEFNAQADPVNKAEGGNHSSGNPHNMWGDSPDSSSPAGGSSQDSTEQMPSSNGHNHGDQNSGAPTGNPYSNDGSNYSPPPPKKDEDQTPKKDEDQGGCVGGPEDDYIFCWDANGDIIDNPNPEDPSSDGKTSPPSIGPAPGDVGGKYSDLMNPGSERGGRPSPDDDNADGPFGFGPSSGGGGNGAGGGPSGPGADRTNEGDDYGCDPLTGGGSYGGTVEGYIWLPPRRNPPKGGGGKYGNSGTGFDDLYKPNPEDDYGVGGPTARVGNSTESVDALVAGQSSETSTEMSAEPAITSLGASFDSFTPSKDVFGAGFEVAFDLQSANSFAPAKADFTKELALV